MREIIYKDEKYIMDTENKTISDEFGNIVKYKANNIPEHNIALYVHMLFKGLHESLESFNHDMDDERMNGYTWEEFL